MRNDDQLLREQDALQTEADEVGADLELKTLLGGLGDPVRVGSAALGLMVGRDLDVTVICPRLDEATTAEVAQVGARLAVHPRVREVRFRDDTGHWNTDPTYPDGLYLGIHYRSPRDHDWTLDIWFVDEPERQPDLAHLRSLPPRLTADARATILRIKRELAARRNTERVPSYEVYRAVLDHGIGSTEEFDRWRESEQD
ncbi:hypothetical protein LX15_000250 [Streptoalloteichus tenebrarius]|uniref:GrpB family protein n=1 Tax=Streptoalloteichus tenebrarius (strain ATCC 17920 / DSM 40477 / JCM 4838 / CBS 697.72 / NBRC 16177 / NCIMB 11028 / NRRL B-12390 / A12253. 1 / ISP 5477) TaxID=1933 RepID=A0ABT1HM35_STRSD|nr:hypothetical protein [Streptoalloteichus tenebrarius]MCP2256567.1 hypothetical protein [Streptoalloteichus tenebrarius]BFF04919.1 hypothetical protein GCM10020241_65940 [Streptoalloteichus tenebrarius]